MVIDARKCIDCKACVVACKAENKVPGGVFRNWIRAERSGAFPALLSTQTLAQLREAVRSWAALYNREWRIGKLKGLSPDEARLAWRQNQAAA